MSQEIIERRHDSSHFHRIYLNDHAFLSIDEFVESGEHSNAAKTDSSRGKEKVRARGTLSKSNSSSNSNSTLGRYEEGHYDGLGDEDSGTQRRRSVGHSRGLLGAIEERLIPFEEMWILTRSQIEQQEQTGCLFSSSPYR